MVLIDPDFKGYELTKEQLEEWIKIREENYMDSRLPRAYILQDNINRMLGLEIDSYNGTGIRTMDLDRENLLRLNLEILKLKQKFVSQGQEE